MNWQGFRGRLSRLEQASGTPPGDHRQPREMSDAELAAVIAAGTGKSVADVLAMGGQELRVIATAGR